MNEQNIEKGQSENERGIKVGYILLGGVGIVGYMLGSRRGYSRGVRYGLRNPVVKKAVEKVDYSDIGKIISRTLTNIYMD